MSQFRVDVLDSSGSKLSTARGPVRGVSSMTHARRLDRIGEVQFSLPASDPSGSGIDSGVQYDVFVDGMDYLGRFFHKEHQVDATGQVLTVSAWDRLRETVRFNTLFNRTYTETLMETVVEELLALVTTSTWIDDVEAGLPQATIQFQGVTVFAALSSLAEQYNLHIRLSEPLTLEFGSFGQDSGYQIVNLDGQDSVGAVDYPEMLVPIAVNLTERDDEVYNRVYPLGGKYTDDVGDDLILTLAAATVSGDYTVQSTSNPDGSTAYYLEDAASVANWGRREKKLVLSSIKAEYDDGVMSWIVTEEQAANSLQLAAEAWLKEHIDPKKTYQVDVAGVAPDLKVGQTVRFRYRGVVPDISFGVEGSYVWIDEDVNLYVLDVERQWPPQQGVPRARLTVSNTLKRPRSDNDLIIGLSRDIETLKFG